MRKRLPNNNLQDTQHNRPTLEQAMNASTTANVNTLSAAPYADLELWHGGRRVWVRKELPTHCILSPCEEDGIAITASIYDKLHRDNRIFVRRGTNSNKGTNNGASNMNATTTTSIHAPASYRASADCLTGAVVILRGLGHSEDNGAIGSIVSDLERIRSVLLSTADRQSVQGSAAVIPPAPVKRNDPSAVRIDTNDIIRVAAESAHERREEARKASATASATVQTANPPASAPNATETAPVPSNGRSVKQGNGSAPLAPVAPVNVQAAENKGTEYPHYTAFKWQTMGAAQKEALVCGVKVRVLDGVGGRFFTHVAGKEISGWGRTWEEAAARGIEHAFRSLQSAADGSKQKAVAAVKETAVPAAPVSVQVAPAVPVNETAPAVEQPVKRGPGRPRKNPAPVAPIAPAVPATVANDATLPGSYKELMGMGAAVVLALANRFGITLNEKDRYAAKCGAVWAAIQASGTVPAAPVKQEPAQVKSKTAAPVITSNDDVGVFYKKQGAILRAMVALSALGEDYAETAEVIATAAGVKEQDVKHYLFSGNSLRTGGYVGAAAQEGTKELAYYLTAKGEQAAAIAQ